MMAMTTNTSISVIPGREVFLYDRPGFLLGHIRNNTAPRFASGMYSCECFYERVLRNPSHGFRYLFRFGRRILGGTMNCKNDFAGAVVVNPKQSLATELARFLHMERQA